MGYHSLNFARRKLAFVLEILPGLVFSTLATVLLLRYLPEGTFRMGVQFYEMLTSLFSRAWGNVLDLIVDQWRNDQTTWAIAFMMFVIVAIPVMYHVVKTKSQDSLLLRSSRVSPWVIAISREKPFYIIVFLFD